MRFRLGVGRYVPVRVGAAVVVVLLGLLAVASAASSAKANKVPLVIASPHSQARLRRGPVSIRIRTARQARLAKVTLNGVSIGSWFAEGKAGAWTLSVSPNYGLRHGVNLLRVKAAVRGRKSATRTARFRIMGTAPLAAAGRDTHVALGTSIHLSGLKSLAPSEEKRSRSRLRYRWTILGAPPASDAVVGSPDATPETAGNKYGETRRVRTVKGADDATARLLASEPGDYRFRLAVRTPTGETGSDRVDLRVDPPPLVPVNTMAMDPSGSGARGILVGDRFIKSTPDRWLQVAVFKRDTLQYMPELSHEYNCPPATTQPYVAAETLMVACIKAVRDDLDHLDDSYLVIAVNQAGADASSIQAPVGVAAALHAIGVSSITYGGERDHMILRGTYSAIGIADSATGTGNQNAGAPLGSQSAGDGALKGYLVLNNKALYGYVSPDRIELNTQAPGSTQCLRCEGRSMSFRSASTRSRSAPWGAAGSFMSWSLTVAPSR